MPKHIPDQPDRGRVVRSTLAYVGVVFALTALGVGGAALHGSLHTVPGDSLFAVTAGVLLGGALWLNQALKRAGLGAGLRKPRLVLVGVLSAFASPFLGLIALPGVNGTVGMGPIVSTEMTLERLDTLTPRNRRDPYYFAQLTPAPGAGGALLPASRYHVGTYRTSWLPQDSLPTPGAVFVVQHRRGVLGARTVLSTLPRPQESQPSTKP